MASIVLTFALALVGLCLASCNGAQGRSLNGEDGLKSQYNSLERPYITPKDAMVNVTNTSPQDRNGFIKHWALWEAVNQKRYYGTKASINVWALPNVNSSQASFSGVWLFNGRGDELNVIQSGWHVHPKLYGDSKTRFYIFWTADNGQKTGCFNLLCKGFVMKNNTIVPGSTLWPLSTIDGDQYHVVLTIYKDAKSGDWWLRYHINDEAVEVGYWPKSIFTSLADNANKIQWGGLVGYSSDAGGPPMGSGDYPAAGFGRAAYIKIIQFVDQNNNLYDPDDSSQHSNYDDDDCYSAFPFDLSASDGYHFFYGGAAGCRG